jgi:diadenosine tetraphosphate (Ap4A) HIT family hydrolase
MASFSLHPALAAKVLLGKLRLCQVLLEPAQQYLWCILVPEVAGATRLIDLTPEQQLAVWQDWQEAQRAIWALQPLDQLNVAALGNVCPQLHLHVVGRRKDDPAWPGPVWGHPATQGLSPLHLMDRMEQLQHSLSAHSPCFLPGCGTCR